MLSPHGLEIAQVSLRADPIEKSRLSRLITQACRLKCLLRLRHKLVAKEFDVMMQRLDLCQLIAQQSQRLLLFPLKSLLGGCEICARLTDAGRIFAGIDPWDCE